GPRPVGCFSALLARPVWIQIWALYRQSGSDRLEKQPTDLRRHHHYMRDGTLALEDHGYSIPGGNPSPAVRRPISLCAKLLPFSIACFTPLRIRSSSSSVSSGSTTSLAILIETISPRPFATTVTFSPPTLTSTVFSARVALTCSCIFAACFIIFWMFIV